MRQCLPWFGILSVCLLGACDKQTQDHLPGAENHPPQITLVAVRPARVLAFQQVLAVCAARDADQDFLKFGWSASAGEFPAGNQSSIVTWKSPPSVGKQTLTVWATDFEDTVSADLEVDIAGVASPESLRFSNGVNVINLNWAGVSDSTIDGWSGYEVFVAPRSMIGLSEAEILTYLVSPNPMLLRSSRVTPVEPGNVIYCQVRSRRDYEGVVERGQSGPEISSAARLDGYAVNAVTGETSPLYEVKSLRGAFGLHIPGGQIEALDPAQRERFDIYIGSSGAEDGPGVLMLKSPSSLAYADPSWSGRVTGIWPLDGDWSTPVPPENPSLSTEVTIGLNEVYGIYTADGHYGKIWILPDDRVGIYPNRRLWVKWAWQPIQGYPRF
jgi:hypothetical protein